MPRFAALMMILLLFIGIPAAGQEAGPGSQEGKQQEERPSYLYQWTDSKGVVHITDSLGKVPKKYRASAQRVEAPAPSPEQAAPAAPPNLAPAPDTSEQEAIEQDRKEEWQQRMRSAKKRLAAAELRYAQLETKRNQLLELWGGAAASGHLEGRAEAARVEEEMKAVKQEIDDARNEIDVVIPDEARKAGIPPGWLRE